MLHGRLNVDAIRWLKSNPSIHVGPWRERGGGLWGMMDIMPSHLSWGVVTDRLSVAHQLIRYQPRHGRTQDAPRIVVGNLAEGDSGEAKWGENKDEIAKCKSIAEWPASYQVPAPDRSKRWGSTGDASHLFAFPPVSSWIMTIS